MNLLQGAGRAAHEKARQMIKAPCPEKKAGMKLFRVVIAAGDRASFEKFVGMYFPGCEVFVMGWVKFEGS